MMSSLLSTHLSIIYTFSIVTYPVRKKCIVNLANQYTLFIESKKIMGLRMDGDRAFDTRSARP